MNAALIAASVAGTSPWRALLIATALASGTLTATAADVPQAAQQRDFRAHVLTRAEFDALLAHPEKILIIDVRRPEELAKGVFPTYLNVQADAVEQSLPFIPRERTLITVSNHANRAGRVADVLASRGFKVAGAIGADVYESEGGHLLHLAPHVAGK